MTRKYPPEPADLKKALKTLLEAGQEGKYVIFTGNKLPKYIWDNLNEEIRARGGTWQTLLKTLSTHYKIVEDWLQDKISWEEMIDTILENIQNTRKAEPQETKARKHSILDFLK